MKVMGRHCFVAMLLGLVVLEAAPVAISGWTEPAEVRHDTKLVLSYRAKWDGDFIVVRAVIEPGWHTFAMDNKQRQQEKLAGKLSLGIEKSTEITIDGLNVAGRWLQSTPKDFSKPEIRWFTWGFEDNATFAAKAHSTGSGPARVEIRGQACAGEICKNIEVALTVPLAARNSARTAAVDLRSLIPVR